MATKEKESFAAQALIPAERIEIILDQKNNGITFEKIERLGLPDEYIKKISHSFQDEEGNYYLLTHLNYPENGPAPMHNIKVKMEINAKGKSKKYEEKLKKAAEKVWEILEQKYEDDIISSHHVRKEKPEHKENKIHIYSTKYITGPLSLKAQKDLFDLYATELKNFQMEEVALGSLSSEERPIEIRLSKHQYQNLIARLIQK